MEPSNIPNASQQSLVGSVQALYSYPWGVLSKMLGFLVLEVDSFFECDVLRRVG